MEAKLSDILHQIYVDLYLQQSTETRTCKLNFVCKMYQLRFYFSILSLFLLFFCDRQSVTCYGVFIARKHCSVCNVFQWHKNYRELTFVISRDMFCV